MDFIFWRQNNEYMYFFTVYEDQFLQFNNVNNLRREMCSVQKEAIICFFKLFT